jgi:hypothetical protein
MNATSLLTGFALVLIAVITIDWARSLSRRSRRTSRDAASHRRTARRR